VDSEATRPTRAARAAPFDQEGLRKFLRRKSRVTH
jgi:hypothetical protein